MKQGQKALICVLGSVVLCTGAQAISSSNPYQAIVDKNVFGLKPPPPLPGPEDQKPPPPNITLTGITTILGRKQALMKTPPPPGAKPGTEQAKEQSYILTIGQREGDIEVLDIDEVAGTVKVNNGGKEITLNFKDNGPKIPATPMPTPAPGVPGAAGIPAPPTGIPVAGAVPPPRTGLTPAASGITTMSSGLRTIPTRTLRLPQGGGPGIAPGAGINIGGTTLPAFGAATQQPQTPTPQPTLSHEEQMIMLEVEREATRNDPRYPPPPPTPLTPPGAAGAPAPPPGPSSS